MVTSILGKKLGMTQIFKQGKCIPVTVIEAGPCVILQVKTKERDGYQALQLGFEEKKIKRSTKTEIGHAKKHAQTTPKKFVKEIKWDGQEDWKPGAKITLADLPDLNYVDVTGTSKGKGFQGGMKRHGFHGGPKSHGQSDRLRSPGSIGQAANPSRVFKGTRMAGHMGAAKRTTRNLKVVEVLEQRGILMVRGGVPGPNGGFVVIKKSLKN